MHHKIAVSFLFFLNLKKYNFFFVTCFLPSGMFVEFTDIRFWCLPSFLVVYCFTVWIYYSLFFLFYYWCTFGLCPVLGNASIDNWFRSSKARVIYITPVYNLELLGHNKFMFSTFQVLPMYFSKIVVQIYIPPSAVYEIWHCIHVLSNSWYCKIYNFSKYGTSVSAHCTFNLHFFDINEVEYIFTTY